MGIVNPFKSLNSKKYIIIFAIQSIGHSLYKIYLKFVLSHRVARHDLVSKRLFGGILLFSEKCICLDSKTSCSCSSGLGNGLGYSGSRTLSLFLSLSFSLSLSLSPCFSLTSNRPSLWKFCQIWHVPLESFSSDKFPVCRWKCFIAENFWFCPEVLLQEQHSVLIYPLIFILTFAYFTNVLHGFFFKKISEKCSRNKGI